MAPKVHPNSIQALEDSRGSGGRPSRRGMAKDLDRMLGENAREALEYAIRVMRGQARATVHRPGLGSVLVEPTIRESLDAAIWLAEMRNGKAPSGMAVQVSGTVDHDHRINAVDLSRLSPDQLDAAEKILNAAGVVDVEFTAAPALVATTSPPEPDESEDP